MPHPGAPALLLRVGDHDKLTAITRSGSVRASLAQRARIVLLAAEGMQNTEIAERVGVSRPTVNRWRTRYRADGIDGLVDEERSGRPREVDPSDIVTATLTPPPARLGVTHWSSRQLARELKVNHVTITKAWKRFGVRPWKADTFKFSTDPELEAKVGDVVGLYLAPPENAVVLCVDELGRDEAR
jgi:transposase